MTTTERCGGGKSTSVEPLLFFSSAESRNKDMASNIKTEDGRHTQQDIKNAATDVLKSKESVKSQVQFKASGSNDATSRSAEERRADKERQRARLAEMRGKMRVSTLQDMICFGCSVNAFLK